MMGAMISNTLLSRTWDALDRNANGRQTCRMDGTEVVQDTRTRRRIHGKGVRVASG